MLLGTEAKRDHLACGIAFLSVYQICILDYPVCHNYAKTLFPCAKRSPENKNKKLAKLC
jgi:hypothetical protein